MTRNIIIEEKYIQLVAEPNLNRELSAAECEGVREAILEGLGDFVYEKILDVLNRK